MTVSYLIRTAAFLIIVPVLVYLIGSLSPLQIVVERNATQMRAGGACYVAMPAIKTLVQIREQCPPTHVLMRFPAQTRAVVLSFDVLRHEPWALGVTALYDEVFSFVDVIIEWTATGMTGAYNIPQRSTAL